MIMNDNISSSSSYKATWEIVGTGGFWLTTIILTAFIMIPQYIYEISSRVIYPSIGDYARYI